MSKRPTIRDLAREAGVSVATVDRVLNNRHRVKESTSHQVLSAADRIGYHAAGLIKRRIKESQPSYSLHFLLQRQEAYFYQQLGQAMTEATEAFPEINGRAVIEFSDEIAPGTIAERLLRAGESADAIAVVAVNHPLVNEAIEILDRKGVPVFCLLTDVDAPKRAGYLGMDNRKRGRTAAWAISRLSKRPGQLGIMLGTHRYLGHEMSESSFRSYLREFAPEFTLMEGIINLDDSRLAYEATVDLITSNPNLVGIYSAGGGVEGLIQALEDEQVDREVVVVCNEITPVTRRALLDRTIDLVIATPIDRLARRTVEAMVDALANPNTKGVLEVALSGDLYISENV